MVKIYNTDCTKGLAKNACIQTSIDKVPNELAEKIVPTFETNPELFRKTINTLGAANPLINATSVTILTATSTTQDMFITGATLSYEKDATATTTNFSIRVIINGATRYIASLAALSSQASNGSISISFDRPIKIDRNSTITVNSLTNNGNFTAYGVVYYYYDETSNA